MRGAALANISLSELWSGFGGDRTRAIVWYRLALKRLTQLRRKLDRNPAAQQSPAVAEVCYPFCRKHGGIDSETVRLHRSGRRRGRRGPNGYGASGCSWMSLRSSVLR